MNPLVPDLEQRLSELQAQVERLRHVPPGERSAAEERLAHLTHEQAEILRRWTHTSERHAEAVARFEAHLAEWSDAGSRIQHDASERLDALERLVHQEWAELKRLHEEPVRQLAEHATSLTQVCIATAGAAQQGFERSEARLSAIETELTRRLSDLTREVHAVVEELRAGQAAGPRLHSGPSPWPLEGVTRLHSQLRESNGAEPTAAAVSAPTLPARADTPAVAGLLPEAASALTERIDSLERALSDRDATVRETAVSGARATRAWQMLAAALAVLTVLAVFFALRLNGDVQLAAAQAEQARQAQQAATDAAARDVAAAREEAARQAADARQRADRAEIIGNVLAAPDLLRYNLVGNESVPGATAQMRWSRSRGFIFSGSRLPAPPPDSTYQVWMLTRVDAVRAATFTPDDTGAVTVVAPPMQVPRAVVGSMVTVEPSGGSDTPSGSPLLARPPEPDAAATAPAVLVPSLQGQR